MLYIHTHTHTHTIFIQHLSLLIQKEFLEISIYFNILFPLTKHKSHITVCVYIKGVGTDLFCKLPRPSV